MGVTKLSSNCCVALISIFDTYILLKGGLPLAIAAIASSMKASVILPTKLLPTTLIFTAQVAVLLS